MGQRNQVAMCKLLLASNRQDSISIMSALSYLAKSVWDRILNINSKPSLLPIIVKVRFQLCSSWVKDQQLFMESTHQIMNIEYLLNSKVRTLISTLQIQTSMILQNLEITSELGCSMNSTHLLRMLQIRMQVLLTISLSTTHLPK